MSELKAEKQQKIEKMATMVKQLDLTGIQLLSRKEDNLLELKRELDRQKVNVKNCSYNERKLAQAAESCKYIIKPKK